jgi:hypothetical protein
LQEVGLLDDDGHIPDEDWEESFGDAVGRRLERQRPARFAGYRRQGMPQQEANAAVARREDEERAALRLKPKAAPLGSASSLHSSSPSSSLAGTHQPGGGRQGAASADGRLGAPPADASGRPGVPDGWDHGWNLFFEEWWERGLALPTEEQKARLLSELPDIRDLRWKLGLWVEKAPGESGDDVIEHVIGQAHAHEARQSSGERLDRMFREMHPNDARRRQHAREASA